jgi:DNA mismatch repair protein PMS2
MHLWVNNSRKLDQLSMTDTCLLFIRDVSIITRHASTTIGTKLLFNGEGDVISRIPYPREIGTTVSIRALFNRFPVRRTELQSHSKREFSQALNIIQSFAIVGRQIQFFQVSSSVDHQPLLTLTPATSIKDTLGQIFGQKLLDTIIPIDEENQEFQVNQSHIDFQ